MPTEDGSRSRATLSEVASQAGVSVSTVSKVLNGRSGVSDETRARIEALLHDHRYQQRTGKRQTAPLLDVLCYEVDSPFGSEVLASIEQSARQRRIGLVLGGATDRTPHDPHGIDAVLQRQPVGVVLIACKLSADDRQRL